MFLHLGGDIVVRTRDLVVILNVDNPILLQSIKPLLKKAESQGVLQKVNDEMKSVAVSTKEIYLSPISSTTLKKRADSMAAFGE